MKSQEGTTQRHWQHWAHKTQSEEKRRKQYNTIQHRQLNFGVNPGVWVG